MFQRMSHRIYSFARPTKGALIYLSLNRLANSGFLVKSPAKNCLATLHGKEFTASRV